MESPQVARAKSSTDRPGEVTLTLRRITSVSRTPLLFAISLLAVGCTPSTGPERITPSTALGWRFGPGFSCQNSTLFEECPALVQRQGGWFLVWTYGTDTFYYTPTYKVRGDRLVFSLQATTSTGNPSGKTTELQIHGADAIHALQRGGAVWWEPDGSYLALQVKAS